MCHNNVIPLNAFSLTGGYKQKVKIDALSRLRVLQKVVSSEAAPIKSRMNCDVDGVSFDSDAVVPHTLQPFSFIQFAHPRTRMRSLCWKCETDLRASQPGLQRRGEGGGMRTGGDTNAALRAMSRSHIQLALVHRVLAVSLHCFGSDAKLHDFILR